MFLHEAILEFEYDGQSRARVVAESVSREVGEIDDDRSRTTLERDGSRVILRVEARDLTALRAALNTWTTLVEVAERTIDVGTRAMAEQ